MKRTLDKNMFVSCKRGTDLKDILVHKKIKMLGSQGSTIQGNCEKNCRVWKLMFNQEDKIRGPGGGKHMYVLHLFALQDGQSSITNCTTHSAIVIRHYPSVVFINSWQVSKTDWTSIGRSAKHFVDEHNQNPPGLCACYNHLSNAIVNAQNQI